MRLVWTRSSVYIVIWSFVICHPALAGGSALRFSAPDHRVTVADDPDLNPVVAVTIEAWVMPEIGVRTQSINFIVSKNINGTGYALMLNGTGDNIPVVFEAANTLPYTLNEPDMRDQWIHFAAVREGDDMRLYVMGQLVASMTATILFTTNSDPLNIGSSKFGLDTNFRGSIDEVRIWQVARTGDQIAADYTRRLNGGEFGLAAYWDFDEGAGDAINDITGHTAPGRLGGVNGPDIGDPEWVAGVELDFADCNRNGVDDAIDISTGTSTDIDVDGTPDECQADCNGNNIVDLDEALSGLSPDCNLNLRPDECDIASGDSPDFNGNGIPDECDPDCNMNGLPDFIDIAFGLSLDEDGNGIPDECERLGDFNHDLLVNVTDLLMLLAAWGNCVGCPEDIFDDGIVNVTDLLILLSLWG